MRDRRRPPASVYRTPPSAEPAAERSGGLRGDGALLVAVALTGLTPFAGSLLGGEVPSWQLGVGVLWVLGPLLALRSERAARSELDLHAHLDDAVRR